MSDEQYRRYIEDLERLVAQLRVQNTTMAYTDRPSQETFDAAMRAINELNKKSYPLWGPTTQNLASTPPPR